MACKTVTLILFIILKNKENNISLINNLSYNIIAIYYCMNYWFGDISIVYIFVYISIIIIYYFSEGDGAVNRKSG